MLTTPPLDREIGMTSRRALMIGALAAGFAGAVRAQAPPARGSDARSAPQTILELVRRSIEVNGKPASVFGIRQPDGTFGISTEVGEPFRMRVANRIDEPSLIHWHGLTPPWQQDGVPGISGPPIPAGGAADYDFPLGFGGTFWMHSHQGLQEQSLMVAPLIVRDERHRKDQQEVVLFARRFQLHGARGDFRASEKRHRHAQYGRACRNDAAHNRRTAGGPGGARSERRQIRRISRQLPHSGPPRDRKGRTRREGALARH